VTEISQQIESFLASLADMLLISYTELKLQNYKPLLDKVGVLDISWALSLLAITQLDSVEEREIALDQYARQYSLNTYYFAIKAATCRRDKRFKQAEINFLEALKLEPKNFEASNNLGMLYWEVLGKYGKARLYFERAIEAKPDLTIARLNLAVLLSSRFDDAEGAKDQYEKILSYENEPKAYNNLSNYYKGQGKPYYGKAEQLVKKAIELNPDYVEAYLNYANLAKVMGQFEKGKELYRKARELDKDKKYKEFIDAIIDSEKG
jgi:tetratricopeptide (TPR) repeat protein